jgi:hypothetical protein
MSVIFLTIQPIDSKERIECFEKLEEKAFAGFRDHTGYADIRLQHGTGK